MNGPDRRDPAARVAVPGRRGDLWIGSAESGRPAACQTVVTVAEEPVVIDKADVVEHRYVFDDSRFRPVPREPLRAAVDATLDGLARGDVFVRCHRGANRSALVIGLVLRTLGVGANEAIEAIRLARSPLALSNPYFADLVHQWPHDPMEDRHG